MPKKYTLTHKNNPHLHLPSPKIPNPIPPINPQSLKLSHHIHSKPSKTRQSHPILSPNPNPNPNPTRPSPHPSKFSNI